MNPFRPTLFTSSTLIERLKTYGCNIYELSETYRPTRNSVSVYEPLPSLTSSVKFELRQWLVDARPSLQIALQSGLLYWGSSCLYESNLLSRGGIQRTISSFLHRPPGYWHRLRSPMITSEPLILLSSHNNPNYFHWLTQPGLAPLFLQEHFALRPITSVAISYRPRSSVPSFIPELLDIFATGIHRIQGIALSSNSLCRFSIQEHSSEVVVSPAQLHWLRKRCHDVLNPLSKPWRRLFISRKWSGRRRCLNEDLIVNALQPYGFERIYLENLRVDEQLRLFSESMVVVGPHGAGFSNLLACPSHAAVVELLPRPGDFSHYYGMAEVLGLRHGHLVATCCDPETDDFTIALNDLIKLLRKMVLL